MRCNRTHSSPENADILAFLHCSHHDMSHSQTHLNMQTHAQKPTVQLESIHKLQHCTTLPFPWLLLAGSGGLANFPSDVLDNLSPAPPVQSPGEGDSEEGPSVDLKDKVEEHFKKHFPSKPQTNKLVHLVCAD